MTPIVVPPAAGSFTAGVVASLSPWNDPAGDWEAYNEALGAMFDQVYSIVEDIGSPDEPGTYQAGWSILLTPGNCPDWALPYNGQYVGVPIQPGTDPAAARAQIQAEQNFQRGTAPAIIAAAKRFLTASQSCALVERTSATESSDPYHFLLVVRPEEIVNLNDLTNAVNAVRPAGVQWTLVQSDAPLVDQYTRLFSAITIPLDACTLADVT